MRRVVITGVGAITPIGIGKDEMWENVKAGKHGFCTIDRFDTSDLKVKVAAQVNNFEPTDFIEKKEVRKMGRFCQFAVAAADMAVKDSGSDFKDLDPFRVGVIFGSRNAVKINQTLLKRIVAAGSIGIACIKLFIV